ncbi:MAG: hypothetical protein Q8P31_08700 [Bacillota bacterium]|nr:hypothetical protein [Bacillota bacterium]
MADVWLSYDKEDNRSGSVTFIAAELERAGLSPRLDARDLRGPESLWSQAGAYLSNVRSVSAWCLYLTEQSISDSRVAGQLVTTLFQAARRRPRDLVTASLFPGSFDPALIPSGLRTRATVLLAEQYWAERLRAAVEGRQPEIPPPGLAPYALAIHQWGRDRASQQAIEIRPRAGSWGPFVAAIPAAETDQVQPQLRYGPRGQAAVGVAAVDPGAAGGEQNGEWYEMRAAAPADRYNSYFLHHAHAPSVLRFGAEGGYTQYTVRLRPVLLYERGKR